MTCTGTLVTVMCSHMTARVTQACSYVTSLHKKQSHMTHKFHHPVSECLPAAASSLEGQNAPVCGWAESEAYGSGNPLEGLGWTLC